MAVEIASARHMLRTPAVMAFAGLLFIIARPVFAQTGSNRTMSCVGDNCVGVGLDICRADVNMDGRVGVQDVLFVLAAFHGSDYRADLDASGTVDIRDLLFVLGAYDFSSCTIPSTPQEIVNALSGRQW